MTHRAGLAYGFTSIGPIAHAYQKALGDVLSSRAWAPDAWMAALGGLPLSYPPGERFHYSHATDVLGFLVGRIAGQAVPRLPVRAHLRAAGHGRHRLLDPAGEARPRRRWSIG